MNLNKFREKVRHSPRIRTSQKRTSTGLYNVCKNHYKTGFTWRYQYRTRDGGFMVGETGFISPFNSITEYDIRIVEGL